MAIRTIKLKYPKRKRTKNDLFKLNTGIEGERERLREIVKNNISNLLPEELGGSIFVRGLIPQRELVLRFLTEDKSYDLNGLYTELTNPQNGYIIR